MKKKILSVLLVFLMLYTAANANDIMLFDADNIQLITAAVVPGMERLMYEDYFDDGTLNKTYTRPSTSDLNVVNESNGAVHIVSDNSNPWLQIWTGTGVCAESEVYAEYEISRNSLVDVPMNLECDGGGNLVILKWKSDGCLSVKDASTNGTEIDIALENTTYAIKLGFYIDINGGIYSLYVNDDLKRDSKSLLNINKNFRSFKISPTGINTVNLETYKLFGKLYSDAEKAEFDASEITSESILSAPLAQGYLIDDLNLPSSGKHGSTITWLSSDKTVIANAGTVKRKFNDNAEVTLTAKVNCGQEVINKDFTFNVASLKSEVLSVPKLMSTLHSDSFNNDTIDTDYIIQNTNGGSIKESNGSLRLTRTTSAGNCFVRFFVSSDKTVFTDKFYAEYILTRDAAVKIQSRSYGNVVATCLDWLPDGRLQYYDKSTNTWPVISPNSTNTNRIKLAIYVDPSNNSYSAWMNNELVIDNKELRGDNAGGFKYIEFSMSDNSSFSVESYKLYNIWKGMPDGERVNADYNALNQEMLLTSEEIFENVIDSSLNLIQNGLNGSEITWSSSNEEIIKSDGTVIRPNSDSTEEVTVTATIKSGSVYLDKSFTFNVLGSEAIINLDVEVDEMIWENSFEDEDFTLGISYDSLNNVDPRGIENGKYYVERVSDKFTQSSVRFYASGYTENNYCHSGVLGLEFTVERDSEKDTQIRIMGSGPTNYLSLTWNNVGNIILTHRENAEDKSSRYDNMGVSIQQKLKVKVLMDTERSMYTLWLNDTLYRKEKYTRDIGVKDFLYLQVYCENQNYYRFTVDDFKLYKAIPPTSSKLDYDLSRLTMDSILTKPVVFQNYIDADLNLYKNMQFGTKITWESSNPDVVDPETGVITRAVDGDDIPVTLTAHAKNSFLKKDVSFNFVILREASSTEGKERADYDNLQYNMITSEDVNAIKESLNLMSKGIFGSDIEWESSNTGVITTSGRVICPRWDENPVNVTLTATIAGKYSKEFDFCVIPDDVPKDPMNITDKDFFGEYKDGVWTNAGMLKYDDYPALSDVKSAVQSGNYDDAKEFLLEYYKNKNIVSPVSLNSRKSKWVEAILSGIADMQQNDYFASTGVVSSSDYEKVEVEISNTKITANGSKVYNIISKYNDSVDISILGRDYPTEDMRPKLVLYVNGMPRNYYATKAATVRAGKYADTSYDNLSELKVKMFGEHCGDETYRTLMQFDINDISPDDSIGKGILTFYAKKSNSYSEPKEFLVLRDSNVDWDESTLTWNSLITYAHNFNGLDGGNHWSNILGSDVEYAYQSCRFYGYNEMISEYVYTGDETYAYCAVQRIMDFINDKGAGSPRTLDTAIRVDTWAAMFKYIINSRYMTPEMCTAIVKRMCSESEVLLNSTATTANWIQTEKLSAYNVAALFPEYCGSAEVKNGVKEKYQEMIKNDYFPDGSYIEDTGSYNIGSLPKFIDMRRNVVNSGDSVSEEYDELLRKGAYYNIYLQGPGTEILGYGDSGIGGANGNNLYGELVEWYGDRYLQYLDTGGTKGEEPYWTSVHMPDSTYVFLRSDWTTKANYLFTNVRGGGTHNHFDDNGIILFGYGRNLVTDAGYVSYSQGEERDAALSTKMHNTVEINNKNQKSVDIATSRYGNQGSTDDFCANQKFDFVSQTSKGYSYINNSHKRTITYIKPDLYIVSDLCTPTNKDETNTYKQLWHMKPDSGMYVAENKIYSGYSGSGNIIIANADNVELTEDEGVYTSTYGQAAVAPYAYYTKEVKGNVTFDTVLLPYETADASLSVEKIDLGVDTSEATALKINYQRGTNNEVTYYMLEYVDAGAREFGNYISDGQMAVVNESSTGEPNEFILYNGSYIKSKDGSIFVDFGQIVSDVYVEMIDGELNIIYSGAINNDNNIKIKTPQDISILRMNGQVKLFENNNGVVCVSSEDGNEIIENDKNRGIGIIDKPSGIGGGAGGSGSVVGGGNSFPVTNPNETTQFNDIAVHWAREDIMTAYKENIIKGYSDNTFRPDVNITRAEFVTLICRAIQLNSVTYANEFLDVAQNDWYAGYISSALNAGIISKDRNFRPNDFVTREEMSKILTNAIKYNKTTDFVPEGYRLEYADSSEISDWASEYVEFVSYYKIMNGRDNNTFAPAQNATRAEAATVVVRSFLNE